MGETRDGSPEINEVLVGAGDAVIPSGLCGSCSNAREIESGRGSRFLLCELSKVDDRFPKYPRLPVLRCRGYEEEEGDGSEVGRAE